MKVAIPSERREHETRVAATPDSVKKLVALGLEVCVERGAGASANFLDADYETAGATLVDDEKSLLADADIVLKVQRPTDEELGMMRKGAALVAILSPWQNGDATRAYASAGIDAFAMELMPRISRAQSMDVLSSQSNLAGYKAVIDAASLHTRAMPMMMTAAGTVAPARVLVLGAGVAGLQAIATAKRLGAIVSATDVRPAVKEQVESLGGTFVMVESEETREAETAGGYAKEMSDDYKRKQAELVAETLKKQDIVICTALIPGRQAPRLITDDMLATMKQGSLVVDLAAEQGGNCEGSRPGETVQLHGVRVMGYNNAPGHVPVDASSLYSRNLVSFLTPFTDKESGTVTFDWEDELIKGIGLTRDGAVVHPQFTDKASDGGA